MYLFWFSSASLCWLVCSVLSPFPGCVWTMRPNVETCLLFASLLVSVLADESCTAGSPSLFGNKKFLLYGVNPGEGFNLGRDVYLRIASVVLHLLEHDDWTLVLPPWGPTYHWRKAEELTGVRQSRLKWSEFFDLSSLKKHVPVVEFDDFIDGPYGTKNIEIVCVLQHFEEGWKKGGWVDKWEIRPCLESSLYEESSSGYEGWFWGRKDVKAKNVSCVSFQGHSALAAEMARALGKRVVMLDRSENILHDAFGDAKHWNGRRSMRFARHLVDVAAKYRRKFLDSDNERDGTVVTEDWRDFKPARGVAKGGPYLAVHLRRRDFLYGRGDKTPSLKGAADKIREELTKLELKKVFIATDGSGADVGELREHLEPDFELFVFTSTPERIKKFHAGGVAIIDQIICAHARLFIGTSESTFSYRIQEEREILGFPVDTTFNIFCSDMHPSCPAPTKWLIRY